MKKEKKLFVSRNLHYLFYALSILGAMGSSWIPFLRDRTDGFVLVMGSYFVAVLLQLRQEKKSETLKKRKWLRISMIVGASVVAIFCMFTAIRLLTTN